MSGIKKTLLISAGGITAGLLARAALRRVSLADLRGQVVLITGGSRGLGLAMARQFARHGCRIAICARDSAELAAAARDLNLAADVLAVPCDVTERANVETMINETLARFGRIDVLVNNAGIIQVGPVDTMTLDDFEQAMRVMFWGAVYPTMTVLPHMLERKSGRIVTISSIGGKVAVPHLLPYACAKFAVAGFSEGLRAEMAGKGIKVVTIAPGLMRTGSYLNAFFKGDQEREAVWFSLSSTMPGISMSADRAARQVVNAARRGEAEKILSLPANFLARSHGLFPGLTADILGLVNRLLLPAGKSTDMVRARDTAVLQTRIMSALTTLGRRAARRFLEEPASI